MKSYHGNYKVTNTYPLPPLPNASGRGRYAKYPFATMKPGESFFVGDVAISNVYQAAYKHSLRNNKKTTFIVRPVVEDGIRGTRVWRVK